MTIENNILHMDSSLHGLFQRLPEQTLKEKHNDVSGKASLSSCYYSYPVRQIKVSSAAQFLF
jgi:hypothetical protein